MGLFLSVPVGMSDLASSTPNAGMYEARETQGALCAVSAWVSRTLAGCLLHAPFQSLLMFALDPMRRVFLVLTGGTGEACLLRLPGGRRPATTL